MHQGVKCGARNVERLGRHSQVRRASSPARFSTSNSSPAASGTAAKAKPADRWAPRASESPQPKASYQRPHNTAHSGGSTSWNNTHSPSQTAHQPSWRSKPDFPSPATAGPSRLGPSLTQPHHPPKNRWEPIGIVNKTPRTPPPRPKWTSMAPTPPASTPKKLVTDQQDVYASKPSSKSASATSRETTSRWSNYRSPAEVLRTSPSRSHEHVRDDWSDTDILPPRPADLDSTFPQATKSLLNSRTGAASQLENKGQTGLEDSESKLPGEEDINTSPSEPEQLQFQPEVPDALPEGSEYRDDSRKRRALPEKPRSSLVERAQNGELPEAVQRRAHVSKPMPKVSAHVKQDKVIKNIFLPSMVTVEHLSRLMNMRIEKLQRYMVKSGLEEQSSYDFVLAPEYAIMLAEDFGFKASINDDAAFDLFPAPPNRSPEHLPLRPPVVTIMGHVDHGKTTILDNLRKTAVAKGEAGGITQHIGAFSVPVNSSGSEIKTITFLDTPGHAAFTQMRARGAQVTDIIVLVVAADDGVMPQTKEVLELIKKDQKNDGKLGVVVAINKVDKPEADIDYVQKDLLSEGLELEVFEGNVPSVNVSGKTGLGLGNLVETLSMVAELQDLRAERDTSTPVFGYVLEARVQKGLGAVATVLVLRGCLKPTMTLIAGTVSARVRILVNSSGQTIKTAYPGDAITVSGWRDLPSAGDQVLSGSESDIKKAISNRLREKSFKDMLENVEANNEARRKHKEERERDVKLLAEAELKQISKVRLERQLAIADKSTEKAALKELKLVIKADVSGSEEAVVAALQAIGNKQAKTKVVFSGVGDVTESDVQLAKNTDGMVIAFSVKTPPPIQAMAEQDSVDIMSSPIIYRLMDDVRERVIKLLPKIHETRVTAEANVLKLFDITTKAKQTLKVAGCKVHNGVLSKSDNVWVIRNRETIFDGTVETLRHMKDSALEIRKGQDCGLSIVGFGDIQPGDTLKFYKKLEKPGIL